MTSPLITLLTPTRNRPQQIANLAGWMERWFERAADQHIDLQWIIADESDDSAERLSEYPRRSQVLWQDALSGDQRLCSLSRNLLRGLEAANGEWLWIIEDDEWYAPRMFDAMLAAMEVPDVKAIGNWKHLAYHLPTGRYRYFRHEIPHSSLCQTALHRDVWCFLRRTAYNGTCHVDQRLWRLLTKYDVPIGWLDDPHLMVSLKGQNGQVGYSVLHSGEDMDAVDADGSLLGFVLGSDANVYLNDRIEVDCDVAAVSG